jgi:hypothetical protein
MTNLPLSNGANDMSRLPILRLSTMLTVAVLSSPAIASEPISVTAPQAPLATAQTTAPFGLAVDQARIVRIDKPAANVVVGNPAIADAALRDANTVFVLGRNFGVTNLLFVDAEGKEVANLQVTVGRLSSATVTLNRGAGQYTYACAPGCDRVLFPTDADFKDMLSPNASAKIDLSISSAHKGSEGQD